MNVDEMRGGYTTGSCATAGMQAGLDALLHEEMPTQVSIENPQGQWIDVPIEKIEILSPTMAKVTVIKDAGDDPDVTHGTAIVTTVVLNDSGILRFFAGEGVGTVTKPGLALPVGEPAINPGPRSMMESVFTRTVPSGKGVDITVSVPEGERLAKKTLNATLGIIGGISIIGTTGIVKPMSEEGFKNSLVPQLRVIKEAGYDVAVLVPGRIGRELAKNILHIPEESMAETSNFIGFMLEQAVRIGFKKILIVGHLGKIIKLSSGSFHTHNRMSDGRMETLAAYAALFGANRNVVEDILEARTTEAAMPIIAAHHLEKVYAYAAQRAVIRSMRYIAEEATVGIILSTLDGQILAISDTAREMGAEEQWQIPCM